MKCKKCGQVLEDDMKFCTNCGSPIEITIKETQKPKKVQKQKPKMSEFKISTTNTVPGFRVVECYGIVNAMVTHLTKSVDFSLDRISGGLSAIADIFNGGRGNYSTMASKYEEVYDGLNKRIIEKAVECGCNAIIGLRYQPQSAVNDDYFYIMAYGTACIIEKEK